MGTGRLESFSDGVIAVAITLLALGIVVPPVGGSSLISQLGRQWPTYAAYVVSFMTIGIIWINHHVMLARLREADHLILIVNLLLLMCIGILPFTTKLMAVYLRQRSGAATAAALYAGSLLLMSLVFSALNRLILLHRHQMLRDPMSLEQRRRIWTQAFTGVIPYVLATALAFVSAYVTLAICAAVAVFYTQPVASGLRRDRGQ
jgi:uncharacterized membrane protein